MGKCKLKTSKNSWIDDIVCLRSKMFSFKWEIKSENKLKWVSQSQS